MSVLSRVVGIFLASRTLSASSPLFQRLLLGVAAVVGSSILIAIMVGVLLIGGVYLAYQALITHGLDPQIAMLTMGGIVFLLTVMLATFIYSYVSTLRDIPSRLMRMESPVGARVSNLADAFMEGFSTGSATSRTKR